MPSWPIMLIYECNVTVRILRQYFIDKGHTYRSRPNDEIIGFDSISQHENYPHNSYF